MATRAVRAADGTFRIGGETYRLLDRDGEHYTVLRTRDSTPVGTFRLRSDGRPFAIEAEGGEEGVIRSLTSLLATPRGLLPLQ